MGATFPGRYLAVDGQERSCSVRAASIDDIEIVTDRVADVGEPIVCTVSDLGVLRGCVRGAARDGFRLSIGGSPTYREKLAARLAWHAAAADGRSDQRGSFRITPDRQAVAVFWSGTWAPGTIRDLSSGGAAVDVTPRPEIGTPVTLGKRRGTVVRHTDLGIGVRFALPLRPQDVTATIVL